MALNGFLYRCIVKNYSITITAGIPDVRLQYNTETLYTIRIESCS